MKPFSAFYYMKENRSKAAVGLMMIVLTAGLFLLGNLIESAPASYEKDFAYGDKILLARVESVDGWEDYESFVQDVKKDEKLHYLERSGQGFPGITHNTAMGMKMGGSSFAFNSVQDMKQAFDFLGIACDYTNLKNRSVVMSKDLAQNRGIKLGDTLDHSFDSSFSRSYTVDALLDDGSYECFFVYEDSDNLARIYVYSDTMEGEELYQYLQDLAGDRAVKVNHPYRNGVSSQFNMFYVIFYIVVILVSVIMAVTVNSVLTGQYMKRKYEFGVYRALGRTKGEVFRKCAKEILLLDLIGSIIGLGIVTLAGYLLIELYYKPQGILFVYTSKASWIGYLLCNILIIIPVILINGRMCTKADVTEF